MLGSIDSLCTIGGFLLPEDLLAFVQTNRKCRAAADSPHLWRSAFCGQFWDELSMFGGPNVAPTEVSSTAPWKLLSLRGIAVLRSWRTLDPAITFYGRLPERVFQVLVSPDLPALSLRRTSEMLESFYMELLADSVGNREGGKLNTEDEIGERLTDYLNEKAMELYQEIESETDKGELADAVSIYTPEMKSNGYRSKARILRLFSALKSTVSFTCSAALAFISAYDSLPDLVSAYCQRWSAYSSSIQALTYVFQSLLDLLSEMGEALFPSELINKSTIVRMMTEVWVNTVYSPLKSRLETQGCEFLLESLRKHTKNLRAMEVESARVLMQALMDISTTEVNCHFAGHSQFHPGKPYADIERKAKLEIVKELYCPNPMVFRQRINDSTKLIQFLFFPCTLSTLASDLSLKEFASARSFFTAELCKFTPKTHSKASLKCMLFAQFLGLTSSDLVSIMSYLENIDSSLDEYISRLLELLRPEEEDYLPDVLLENRKRTLGLTFEAIQQEVAC